MNLVLMTEGTGQGVHGRKTNVSRLYDMLLEGKNQRINLEAGPGTHAFRHLGGTFFGADAMSIVNHHQNWFLNHAPKLDRTVRVLADRRWTGLSARAPTVRAQSRNRQNRSRRRATHRACC